MASSQKAPTPKASTTVLKKGEQQVLTPVWENPQGKKVDLDDPDTFGNQVLWRVIPSGIVDIAPNLVSDDKPGGVEATVTAVGLGSCTVVATAATGLVSAEMHINVVSEGPVEGEIKTEDV
jgi:hypothetical protein